MIKSVVCGVCGAIGSAIAFAIGGFDPAIITLSVFMGIDLITGIIVAGVFHKSKKTETGSLKSIVGFKGLSKKVMIFLFIIIANLLDEQIGTTYIRDAVCIAFMVNELLSIVENAGLMGVPIPSIITRSIDVLKSKEEVKTDAD